MLSLPTPPEDHDKGEDMLLSDLPLPSDISEAQDLEQDLVQVLDNEHYPAEVMRQVQSIAGSTESQEEPNPTFLF